ncbi:MAG: GNAT family N-acetyltransferase [Gemmatimonadaceae bacterium]
MAGITTPLQIAPVTLAGRFVSLEPLTLAHGDALAEFARDPSIWSWMPTRALDRVGLDAWIGEALAAQKAGTALPFATVLLAENRVVGSTRFLNISARDGRVEIGATWIGVPYQRSAVNTEAKLLMLRHAFETLGATRVELKTHSENVKSRRAIERIGATFEGIHRKHMLHNDGSRRDTVWYSILDDEWPAVNARLEEMLHAAAPSPRRAL